MVGKEIDPSDIGKHQKLIKAAQKEMSETDVLVCGKCHNVFHFIDMFKEHKEEGCENDSTVRECKETKPRVWAFLLWKAAQLSQNDASTSMSPWKLYQTWLKMEESVRETWIVAGNTIQSFSKIGQGNLQEMPVKITKTVVDNSPQRTTANQPNRYIKSQDNKLSVKKDEDIDTGRTGNVGNIRKPATVSTIQNQKIPINVATNKIINRKAKRTVPNKGGQEFEDEIVEKIIAKRFNPRKKIYEYLVKWEDYSHDHNTWEPPAHLDQCPELVDTFERQLARQKEQRAAQASRQATSSQQHQQQSQTVHQIQQNKLPLTSSAASPNSPSRPLRSSKTKALDQVKQWCTDDDINTSTGGVKRKHDDNDYMDSPGTGIELEAFEEESIPSHAVKKLKNGGAVAVKIEAKSSDSKHQVQPTLIRAVNGSIRHSNESSADVVITKENQTSGIVKKSGFSTHPTTSHKSEAQIRVLSKGENATSGVVRITNSNSPQLSTATSVTTVKSASSSAIISTVPASTRITQLPAQTQQQQSQQKFSSVGQLGTPSQAQISQVQTHRIVMTPKDHSTPLNKPTNVGSHQPRTSITRVNPNANNTRFMQTPSPLKGGTTTIQRTSLSPGITSSVNQQQSPTSGKMIISNRGVKSAPTSKNVTPEQKIIQLSKSGDLKVTRKVITHSPQPSKTQTQPQHQLIKQPNQVLKKESEPQIAEEYARVQSPPRPMTLCPVTGKILTHGESEQQQIKRSPVKKDNEIQIHHQQQTQHIHQQHQNPQAGIFQATQRQPAAEEQQTAEITHGTLALATTEDGQIQQLITEDGAPLLVTGEDGTIYQVAGKNAEGQTILIAQGADGEQQFAYVAAAEDGEEGGVLALDDVAEAVAQMLPEQAEALAAAAGNDAQFIIKHDIGNAAVARADPANPDAPQALTIQTGDANDSQDANIPAEVVQADLPSPGGTRRVVLLLQDGTFMMTEMHDDEYRALNLVT